MEDFPAGGLSLILLVGLASFLCAFSILLFFIAVPKQTRNDTYSSPLESEDKEIKPRCAEIYS